MKRHRQEPEQQRDWSGRHAGEFFLWSSRKEEDQSKAAKRNKSRVASTDSKDETDRGAGKPAAKIHRETRKQQRDDGYGHHQSRRQHEECGADSEQCSSKER